MRHPEADKAGLKSDPRADVRPPLRGPSWRWELRSLVDDLADPGRMVRQ